ncbi:hypothetical protein BD410DRAFT_790435 [Rickenella mellea]|uniref:Uncharacterized protein n=1 Tax=Rickenella mellea TaxID=50990 RepID=A0A4Y7Q1N2_9AGAM|nr:hypothetical protein BD410DRAFT_790435 [Rickenella mellea]
MQLKNSVLSLLVVCAFSGSTYGSPLSTVTVTVCPPCPTPNVPIERTVPTLTFNPGGPIITASPGQTLTFNPGGPIITARPGLTLTLKPRGPIVTATTVTKIGCVCPL